MLPVIFIGTGVMLFRLRQRADQPDDFDVVELVPARPPLDPALKALVFQLLESTPLSSRWFQISTCTPLRRGEGGVKDVRESRERQRGVRGGGGAS